MFKSKKVYTEIQVITAQLYIFIYLICIIFNVFYYYTFTMIIMTYNV